MKKITLYEIDASNLPFQHKGGGVTRILVNGLSARLGGGQTYLLNLLRHLPPDADLEIFLLCSDNFELTGLPKTVVRLPSPYGMENPFRRSLWERTNLEHLALKVNARLLFSPGGMIPPIANHDRLKTAVTFQNMLPFDHAQRRRYPLGYRRLRDWLLERQLSSSMLRANLIIFISQYARNFILRQYGPPSGKEIVVPHGIDHRFFFVTPLLEEQISPDNQSPYFLYVSFIDYYKSQIEVVRAFHQVRQSTGTQAKLLLVGAEYPHYGKLLRKEIEHLGLQSAVEITGNIPHADLPALYQQAEINLFASCTENCPNILFEIMASGRPALVSERGPMREFARDTVTYFDPDNINELARKWAELIVRDSIAASEMAKNATQAVATYNWGSAARKTWEAIDRTARGAA